MKIQTRIPSEFMEAINNIPYNKSVKKSAIKIYGALKLKSKHTDSNGYFFVPSTFLHKVNIRYNRIIKYFIEKELIKPYTRVKEDPNDIFNSKQVRYYDTNKGICMKYKFLVDTNTGKEIEIDFGDIKENRWYVLTYNSLSEIGFNDIKIGRDTFSRRLHHNAIMDYKTTFKGYDVVDSVSSQPRLLYNLLKANNIYDKNYYDIFENNKDFYKVLCKELNISERDDAKELFMFWIGSKGYVPNYDIHKLFPEASSFIKNSKKSNSKEIVRQLQKIESDIWIDGILNNINVDWAITIHDSIIVKPGEGKRVLEWIENKYPELKLKLKTI
jgi:hypothetical protein